MLLDMLDWGSWGALMTRESRSPRAGRGIPGVCGASLFVVADDIANLKSVVPRLSEGNFFPLKAIVLVRVYRSRPLRLGRNEQNGSHDS